MIGLTNKDTLKRLDFKHPAPWVATWFGCGLMQPAPGTWGTLGALPFGILFLMIGGIPLLALASIACFIIGLWAAKHMERMIREKDSSLIVIDEAVGLWISLMPSLLTPSSVGLAFVLFRIFDIIKPLPIGWLDNNLKGPAGVMIDDVVAGIYAAAVLIILRYIGIL